MVYHEINLLCSSNPQLGASNTVESGDRFRINFNEELKIPRNATKCTIKVLSANIWWTIKNIDSTNNKFILRKNVGFDEFTNPITVDYNYTIPEGLYDISSLQTELSKQFVNQGFAADLIVIVPNNNTQVNTIAFTESGWQVVFNEGETCHELLGFQPRIVPDIGVFSSVQTLNGTPIPDRQIGDFVAKFSNLSSFLISSDIVSQGIMINGNSSQVIAEIGINAPPGAQIIYQPWNLTDINAYNIIGQRVASANFYLTDQNGNAVDTNGEYWSCRLIISYYIPD